MRLSHGAFSGLAIAALFAGGSVARAGELDETLDAFPAVSIPEPSLSFSLTEALAQPPAAPDQPPSVDVPAKQTDTSNAPRSLGYGQSGSRWWTFGTLYANNFKNASDFNVHVAFSQFIADDVEFAVEAAGWYFHQPGDDTGGLSGSMVFRWHLWHPQDYKWTIFGDAGIGILGAFDEVPDGGTGFDFLPRLGAGFTYALEDPINGESRGARLMVGVRYHHISNGRIAGDNRNPARDGIAVYAALVIPF